MHEVQVAIPSSIRNGPIHVALWERVALRLLDVTIAVTALVVLAAPMLLVAALIRLGDRGPALFRQRRVGRSGVPFTLYKFRTMHVGCGDQPHRELVIRELSGETTAVDGSYKLAQDQRVTAVGAWLRRTSLDELPQLVNVLRGEMALVGPRPCLEWEAEMFPSAFAARFAVPPGLTGLWQVSGRSTLGTLDMLRLDVEYVRRRGFWNDLKILARTVPTLLRRSGAR